MAKPAARRAAEAAPRVSTPGVRTGARVTRSRTLPAAASRVEPVPATSDPIHALPGDPDFMTSLARGLTVIGAFTRQKRQLTIAQISQRTGIPRAAVRRCLYTLGRLGFVGTEDRRSFALRPRILELGHAYMT
jgi:IclR family pca regulon transcriptional regulator